MKSISDEQKIYELSKLWKEAAYNFAFWDKVDIDWDNEYKKALSGVLAAKDIYEHYRELSRFAALLGDGHTGVYLPAEIIQDPEYFSMLPVFLWSFGSEIAVLLTTEEMKELIPRYSVVKKIDGKAASDYVRENCYPYIWHGNESACGMAAMNELMYGRRGSSAVFTFEKDGREFDVRLERQEPAKMVWDNSPPAQTSEIPQRIISSSEIHKVSITEDNIAVIKMLSFSDDSLPEKIYSVYEELKKARGYIIDVRGNSGGNSKNGDAVAALFIKGAFRSCLAETQVYQPEFKAWSVFREDLKGLSPQKAEARFADDEESLKLYKMSRNINYIKEEAELAEDRAPGKLEGPVAVLMNEYTVSAAEDFIDVMKMYTDAVFVGANTAGTSGQPLVVQLESGGAFRICTRRCIAQNGEDIYNKGFAPDITAAQTMQDAQAGIDRAFEKGLEILRAGEGKL